MGSRRRNSRAAGSLSLAPLPRARHLSTLADDVRAAGGTFALATEVTGAERRSGELALRSADGGGLIARRAVFCAGLWADRAARAAGADADPRIVPFRGQYLTLAPQRTPS